MINILSCFQFALLREQKRYFSVLLKPSTGILLLNSFDLILTPRNFPVLTAQTRTPVKITHLL